MARFRRSKDGGIFVPSRGKPPEPPEGYVRDSHNPFRFLPETIPDDATSRELYQHLYTDPLLKYGDSSFNRCPGVRFLPLYLYYLEAPVFDFGCGRGHVVDLLRRKGIEAEGMDQIDLVNEHLVGDITQPLTKTYTTAISLDVFEHLFDDQLIGLLENMKSAKKQVISVHTGRSYERGVRRDLHINKKSFSEWEEFLTEHLTIVRLERIGRERGIFFCTQSDQ